MCNECNGTARLERRSYCCSDFFERVFVAFSAFRCIRFSCGAFAPSSVTVSILSHSTLSRCISSPTATFPPSAPFRCIVCATCTLRVQRSSYEKKLTLHSHCRRQHSHSHMPLPICALRPPPRLNVRNALCGSALHCMHTRKDTTQRRIRKTLQPTLACSECKFSACVCALASSSLNLESVSVCRSPITFASHSVSTFPLGCFARRPPALCKGLNASVAS